MEAISKPMRTLRLSGRQELFVEGVSDVVRFCEDEVLLDTELGLLQIEGEGLRIARLDPDKKEAFLCGNVMGIFYTEQPQKKKGGFFSRS